MDHLYFTVREIAIRYSVATTTVYGMCAQGKLPHIRIGVGRGTIRIAADAMERLLAQTGIEPTPSIPPIISPTKPEKPRLNHMKI